jgi:DNA polymerase-3 subunit beta
MRLKIQQSDLNGPLQAVSRSVGIRTTLPVLANILLQAQGNKLILSATNLEIGVIKTINASVEEEGELTVPAKTFQEIISSLGGMELTLESGGEQLRISAKKFNVTLNGISSAEFPAIPLAADKAASVQASVLKDSIPQIAFAAAADDGRPVLTGILTEITKHTLELVATDGFRLAHKKMNLESVTDQPFKSLIPRRTLEEVVRLIGEDIEKSDSGLVEIGTSENQIIFKVGDTQVSSRLIEGNFPSWEKIVPTDFQNITHIDRVDLLKAVKLASVFAKTEANVIKLEVLDGKIKISSQAREVGEQETEIEAQTGQNPIQIAFNAKYLTDALSSVSSEKVRIEFSGNLSAALIKPEGIEGLEYVIMPIRLS